MNNSYLNSLVPSVINQTKHKFIQYLLNLTANGGSKQLWQRKHLADCVAEKLSPHYRSLFPPSLQLP